MYAKYNFIWLITLGRQNLKHEITVCEKPTLQEAGVFYKSRGPTPISRNLGTNEEKGGQKYLKHFKRYFYFGKGVDVQVFSQCKFF